MVTMTNLLMVCMLESNIDDPAIIITLLKVPLKM